LFVVVVVETSFVVIVYITTMTATSVSSK